MRSFVIKPGDLIPIGRAGENQATEIRFDVTGWADTFGAGTYTLVMKRPGESVLPYPITVTVDGDYVVWVVSNVDTGIVGNAQVQLRYTVDGALAKSVIYRGIIGESLDNIVDPPDPYEDLIGQMVDLTERAEAAAESASGSAGTATTAAEAAQTAKTAAETAAGQAQSAKEAAQASATTATQAKEAAQTAQSSAEAAQSAAASSATAASGSATAAAGSATQAAASATAAAQSAATLTLDATLTSATQAAQAKAVGDALNNVRKGTAFQWTIASLAPETGGEISSSTRIRSEYIAITPGTKVMLENPDKRLIVYTYDKDRVYITCTAWTDGNLFVSTNPNARYIRVLIRKTTSNPTIVTSDIDTLTSQLTIVLAIPSDVYTVGNLGRIDILPTTNVVEYTSDAFQWQIGSLSTGTGDAIDSTTRLRSDYISTGKGCVLKLRDGTNYRHLIYKYGLDKEFISSTAWVGSDIVVPSDCYIRILLKYADDRTVDATNSNTLIANGYMIYKYPVDNIMHPSKQSEWLENAKSQADIVRQKKTNLEQYAPCDAKIMYFTDVHGDANRTKNLSNIVGAWGASFTDAMLCGGDIVTLVGTEDLDWYYDAFENVSIPLLNVVGNHDAWATSSPVTILPKADVYEAIVQPTVASGGFVQPENAEANGYNYYYKDFNNKVRLIVLDCMYWDDTQLAWFESVLASARTDNLHVVCASHAAFPLADMTVVDCLWSKSGVNTDTVRTNIAAASAVKDFMDDGGKFVAWLVGHQHGDFVHKLESYGDQFVINLGSFAQRAGFLLKSTNPDAYNYNCMTYITVDATNSMIRLLRIGADIDIYGTKHNGLVIDYANKRVVSSWS